MEEEISNPYPSGPDFGTLLAMLDVVFQPSSAIKTREFFFGRVKQFADCIDAIGRSGAHIALYGDRGVGKTSISNIVQLPYYALDKPVFQLARKWS